MSNAKHETIADIVAEMRIGDLCAIDTSARTMYINDFLASYADRIEAAWKREQEAGAAAAQICGEIGEIVGRATTEKSSAVVNTDTVRGIAQEMLNTSMQEITAERINEWATRLAAACEQSVTDCNQLNNTAAMREAVKQADILISIATFEEGVKMDEVEKIRAKINAAIAEPIRNCDVGTAEEQTKRFAEYCDSEVCKRKRCKSQAKALCIELCALAWAQIPYEEGGAK